jgi:hypothetical protein
VSMVGDTHGIRNVFVLVVSHFRFLNICFLGTDAILKDANDEFKIIDFVHLVKIAADS